MQIKWRPLPESNSVFSGTLKFYGVHKLADGKLVDTREPSEYAYFLLILDYGVRAYILTDGDKYTLVQSVYNFVEHKYELAVIDGLLPMGIINKCAVTACISDGLKNWGLDNV